LLLPTHHAVGIMRRVVVSNIGNGEDAQLKGEEENPCPALMLGWKFCIRV
jgi:hypothetical protein